MGILNWIVAKSYGIATVSETCEKSLDQICKINGIAQHSLKIYKTASIVYQGHYLRTYAGDVIINGEKKGAVIQIDETSGRSSGFVCRKCLIVERDAVYHSYLNFQNRFNTGGPLAGFFDEKITGARIELKSDNPLGY